MIIQLPTGRTVNVDSGWWLSLSDKEIKDFFDTAKGSDIDPLSRYPLSSAVEEEEGDEEPNNLLG